MVVTLPVPVLSVAPRGGVTAPAGGKTKDAPPSSQVSFLHLEGIIREVILKKKAASFWTFSTRIQKFLGSFFLGFLLDIFNGRGWG